MKKSIICGICLLLFIVLIACGADNKQATNTNQESNRNNELDLEEIENIFAFTEQSLQGFIDRFASKNSVLSNDQTAFFVRAANSVNLEIENYSVLKVVCTPGQRDDGTLSGNFSLDVYWHGEDCVSCASYCEKIYWHLIYNNDGLDKAGIIDRPEYTQTDEPNLYVKELVFADKTSYIYLIDDYYMCRCSVDNDVPEKEKIAEQLVAFGKEMKVYLDSNQNHEVS